MYEYVKAYIFVDICGLMHVLAGAGNYRGLWLIKMGFLWMSPIRISTHYHWNLAGAVVSVVVSLLHKNAQKDN